ncbi:MAG TPA: hypothetical protein PLZ84_04645, partial [Clostridia bacterium]|nr:hypothetical protein [Clostridia bacterium]
MKLKRIIIDLCKSKFVHNALTLIGGTAVSQVITFAASIVVFGFYYSDHELGTYAVFVMWMELAAIVTTGRYELTILLPDEDNDGFNITVLCIILSTFLSLLIFLCLALCYVLFESHLTTELKSWMLILPLA